MVLLLRKCLPLVPLLGLILASPGKPAVSVGSGHLQLLRMLR